MAAASSCSDIIPREKYDVFLSFRGEDTRNSFTSHLYEALCRNKIQTYIDYKLERGDEISPALLKAISESKLSVIIFSKNYASSTWCLEELVHILQCRDKQFVIPIFYGVDPSHVRRKLGSYADAFVKHEERVEDNPDKVLRWRDALTTAANISGFDSQTIRVESELIKTVVEDILEKLNRESSSCLEGKVGIKKKIQQVESLLCLHSLDVQTLGIWGMGGIGKTTIAEVVFGRLSSQFEACCFIANVSESEAKHVLNDLRNQILCELLQKENLRMATSYTISNSERERLRRTKALIVLDGVSAFRQIQVLVGGDNMFGPGSRILVTTRNKRIFGNLVNEDKIYEVKELDVDEALELFYLRANVSFPGDYTTFAEQVVDYARGNPLALTILGSVFSHCRSKEDWESELDKVKKFPSQDIQNVLRLSYDGLEENEKDIFLDIACYYKGERIDYANRMLHASGFCANAGIRLLIDMSLISVDKCSRFIKMHDLIQEMGHKIVRDQGVKNPGKRSRLWIANDVCYVLQNNRGTGAIECLVMSLDHISDLDIKPSAFKQMHNLRLLKLHFERYCDPMSCVNKVHLPRGLECLPQALRIMQWDGYPLNSLPSKFCAEKLVELRMRNSRLQRLWNEGVKINLGSLKHIDLSDSQHLADVSALIESPNLETIILECCTSLVQLPSFQHLAKLTDLNLYSCFNLKILPEMPGNLESLYLDGTAIEELPSSIWCLEKLYRLGLEECEELKNLPSTPCRLNSLRILSLEGCLSLECLPVELPSGLEYLYLSSCESLGSLPVELPSGLKSLSLRNCKSLGSLPVELPSGLEHLYLSSCESLGSLPVELPSGLKSLSLRNCKSLGSLPVELPSGLKELILSGCESLGSLPVKLPSGLKKLDLRDCVSLGSLPVELPSVLENLYLSNCKSLGSLPKLPWLLNDLQADGCMSLERIAPVQGWDQYFNRLKEFRIEHFEQHIFINCLKLDQSARSNIMADAQLRVMRIAYVPGEITIVCPGNKIPKWLRYQSEGCSINIKLPPHWHREGFMGFALCIVVAFNNYTPPDIGTSFLSCETHHKTNNCQELRRKPITKLPDNLNSDHVFVWYFRPEYVVLESAINRQDWVKASEASFDFILYNILRSTGSCQKINPFAPFTVRVKRCGVSLLYAQDLENFFGGIDEDVVMEPKQVVEKEDIIIKTKETRRPV
ncbi:disease resistance-like protein DSC1 [Rosa rugosa]|uniref:disease resistance-like protein DSC1 n=1 Tax=Rosa rugosa TaxID=74645 RepID=UPI002B41549D|nr:disease resistance-like protein DSC1 [Rosa rugosa]XP_062002319.1 disease resistance-like protein DSC1 [Rosa rugosa]XP_062002320.1 disease resistance-like protein DSC1 [Rosa rugosa]XP_062002321.1 disease resistance-like protein DSC1 [Rosa rugosa]XP_062002322.1 disease resistance-like protein DSC1 [Rosa rugosa]XP_062002323.1 disease resistance-like protein DSC1 [Rosa rugosa]XP_062002324.1 disease resistance-like protein DSC1 [Rosa rugosa]XP_062002325.1 disease resistance-like protein DSC1 [